MEECLLGALNLTSLTLTLLTVGSFRRVIQRIDLRAQGSPIAEEARIERDEQREKLSLCDRSHCLTCFSARVLLIPTKIGCLVLKLNKDQPCHCVWLVAASLQGPAPKRQCRREQCATQFARISGVEFYINPDLGTTQWQSLV